jgi:hypothetical protein
VITTTIVYLASGLVFGTVYGYWAGWREGLAIGWDRAKDLEEN